MKALFFEKSRPSILAINAINKNHNYWTTYLVQCFSHFHHLSWKSEIHFILWQNKHRCPSLRRHAMDSCAHKHIHPSSSLWLLIYRVCTLYLRKFAKMVSHAKYKSAFTLHRNVKYMHTITLIYKFYLFNTSNSIGFLSECIIDHWLWEMWSLSHGIHMKSRTKPIHLFEKIFLSIR